MFDILFISSQCFYFSCFLHPPLCCPGSLGCADEKWGEWHQVLVAGFRSTVYPVAMKCSICRGSFVYILYHVKDGSSLFFLLAGVSNRERLSRFLQSHFLYLLGDLWPHSNAVLNICEDVCSVSKWFQLCFTGHGF